MRVPASLTLLVLAGCAGTLYSHYAGPAEGNVDEAYACVQEQLKQLGYARVQFNQGTHWFVAQKVTQEQSSSGLYQQTVSVLDTKVNLAKSGEVILDIKARSYDQYATARGNDKQEEKAGDRVQADARVLGRACAAK